MKSVLTSAASPTFTPGAANAGTLNFATAVASYGFQFGRLLGIINLTQSAIIYTAGVSGFGGSWNSGTSVLTLAQATTGQGSGDVIEVIWDDPRAGVAIVAPTAISGGWPASSAYHAVFSTASSVNVKSSAGTVGGIFLNTAYGVSGDSVVKLYDLATAPSVGAAGVKLTFSVNNFSSPYSNTSSPVVFTPPAGIAFANGISFTITGGLADAATTAPISSVVNILYI
jgi:hypothetical protein